MTSEAEDIGSVIAQEIDKAIRDRAAVRVAEGEDAREALAQEETLAQLVRAYE